MGPVLIGIVGALVFGLFSFCVGANIGYHMGRGDGKPEEKSSESEAKIHTGTDSNGAVHSV